MASTVVRAALLAYKVPGLLHLALTRAVDAVVLGVGSDATIDAITTAHYETASSYLSDEHDERGLFDWERQAVGTFFPRGGKVLVTSAGGGREPLALLDMGFRVVATECVPALGTRLERRLAAPAASGAARVVLAPPDEVPREHGPFDAAVVGWGSYSHLQGRARRVRFLERVRASLVPGAPLLLSFVDADRERRRSDRVVAAVANLVRGPLGRRPVERGETLFLGCFTRRFAEGEVQDEARAAGLAPIEERRGEYPHLVARAAT